MKLRGTIYDHALNRLTAKLGKIMPAK